VNFDEQYDAICTLISKDGESSASSLFAKMFPGKNLRTKAGKEFSTFLKKNFPQTSYRLYSLPLDHKAFVNHLRTAKSGYFLTEMKNFFNFVPKVFLTKSPYFATFVKLVTEEMDNDFEVAFKKGIPIFLNEAVLKAIIDSVAKRLETSGTVKIETIIQTRLDNWHYVLFEHARKKVEEWLEDNLPEDKQYYPTWRIVGNRLDKEKLFKEFEENGFNDLMHKKSFLDIAEEHIGIHVHESYALVTEYRHSKVYQKTLEFFEDRRKEYHEVLSQAYKAAQKELYKALEDYRRRSCED